MTQPEKLSTEKNKHSNDDRASNMPDKNNIQSKNLEFLKTKLKEAVRSNLGKFKIILPEKNHWEKWFQIELAFKLAQSDLNEVCLERKIEFNKNKSNTKDRVENDFKSGSVDIAYRPKKVRTNCYIGVELKQNKGLNGLKSLLKDIIKLHAAKKSVWDYRALFFVLLCTEDGKNNSRSKNSNLLRDLLAITPCCCEEIKFSRTHSLQAIIVYWAPVKSPTFDSFKSWYKPIKDLLEKHELSDKLMLSRKKVNSTQFKTRSKTDEAIAIATPQVTEAEN